jgi:hypothetical protein
VAFRDVTPERMPRPLPSLSTGVTSRLRSKPLNERNGLISSVRNRRKRHPIVGVAQPGLPLVANQHFDSVQNCSDS